MLHSIFQFLNTEYIYVQVMCSLIEVSIQYMSKVLFTLIICMSKSIRADCLCITPRKRGSSGKWKRTIFA